jgi:hypothetical protein
MLQHCGSVSAVSMFNSPRPVHCLATAATSIGLSSAFASVGIDPEECPHVLETRSYAGRAHSYFNDEQGRTSLVDLPPPVQPELVHAFDTTDTDGPQVGAP